MTQNHGKTYAVIEENYENNNTTTTTEEDNTPIEELETHENEKVQQSSSKSEDFDKKCSTTYNDTSYVSSKENDILTSKNTSDQNQNFSSSSEIKDAVRSFDSIVLNSNELEVNTTTQYKKIDYFKNFILDWIRYYRSLIYDRELRTTEFGIIFLEAFILLTWFLDSLLVIKLFVATLFSLNTMYNNIIALTLLTTNFAVAIISYTSRGQIIYQRLPHKRNTIFVPFCAIPTIRSMAENSEMDNLVIYDRLMFTFTIIQRIMTDIPQLVMILFYLIEEADFFIITTVAINIVNVVMSTCKMGYKYPWAQTFAYVVSSNPPVQSNPSVIKASPTTKRFFPFLFFVFALTFGSYCLCTFFTYGYRRYGYIFITFVYFVVMFLAGSYTLYLKKEFNTHSHSEYSRKISSEVEPLIDKILVKN